MTSITRNLQTVEQTAKYLGVTPRTIRNYVSKGLIPAYRIPGTRGIRLDLDEVTNRMRLIPTTRARSAINEYGPRADIRILPAQPVRVDAIKPGGAQ
jgi:excisionase family DNA binding protein